MNMDIDIVGRYSDIINSHPLLSRLDERRLFKILKKLKGGKQRQITRDKIFNSNISLVMKYARHYSNCSGIALEDLIGAGTEGLGEAINRFNYKRGNKFSTYAVPWIKLSIFRTLNTMGRAVSIPPYIVEKARKYSTLLNNPKTSEQEIKKEMRVTEKVLGNVRAAKINSVSLNQPYGEDDGDTLSSIIPDPKSLSTNKHLMDVDRHQLIREVISELPNMQREIIKDRYLCGEKNNLKEIGGRYKITGERVRQIEVKALRKLKFKLRQRGYLRLHQVSYES